LFSEFEDPYDTWTNTSQHALNSLYALFEIIFPRTAPPPYSHIIAIIAILALYLGLAYLTYAVDDYFVYDFLDNKTNSPGKVAGYILGILVGSVIVFLLVRFAIVLRTWITENKLGKTGVTSARGEGAREVEDAEKNVVLQDNQVR
jgi:hypothetical protein